jgi:hypothetical protein
VASTHAIWQALLQSYTIFGFREFALEAAARRTDHWIDERADREPPQLAALAALRLLHASLRRVASARISDGVPP